MEEQEKVGRPPCWLSSLDDLCTGVHRPLYPTLLGGGVKKIKKRWGAKVGTREYGMLASVQHTDECASVQRPRCHHTQYHPVLLSSIVVDTFSERH
jgi:hypothetical protein